MIKPLNTQLNPSDVHLGIPGASMLQAIKPLHWIGYGLLILALFNLIEILISPDVMNPVWEFQAIGAIVEQAPLILVGLVIVFLVDRYNMAGWEEFVLKFLSWLALFIGVIYLLLIPLSISDTLRIHQQTNQELSVQVEQKQELIQQVKEEVNQVQTADELEQLISSLNNAGVSPEISDAEQLAQVKTKLSEAIVEGEQELNTQVQAARSEQFETLFKKSVKWNLGALVSGLLFISVWQGTRWARCNS
ncbi:MAG: hypothetical protein HC769_24305 [Cyanobacteria bacterium CRU_2_1]|nr:hypothetical protein [Cyanobacteria bacterium CRU_2_1]